MHHPKRDQSNILIVDDKPANLRLLSSMLTKEGHKVRSVINGEMALTAACADPPDLILLDISMPGMNGYEVCEALKADERTEDIPVLFVSALDVTQGKVKAFTAGGVDYITKPFQVEEVLARVRTHLALRNLQRDLEREIAARDRLIAELDAFAHTVAHDLKNPLAVQVSYASMLEVRYDALSDEEMLNYLGRLSVGARKMANIVDELLLLAGVRQMDEVTLKPLDMGRVVGEALRRLEDMIDEYDGDVVVTVETWPPALGYAPWIEEIWVNYLSNALKYGGEPPRVELGATPQNDGPVKFWVRDNGDGLDAEAQAQLFVPFERLGQVRTEGHGLGLSIVQRIAEKLGGRVGVNSGVGEGSTFYFTLPSE
jgi:two-component system, sensor histidine kinase and response regulator